MKFIALLFIFIFHLRPTDYHVDRWRDKDIQTEGVRNKGS